MSQSEPGGEYADAPLPEHLTVPGWRIGLIIASFSVALPGFLNGAQTGLALGLTGAVLAALLAGIVLCAGGCITSIVSVRTRLNTYLLVQRSFGLRGAVLINLIIAVIHFCWFGVNVSFFGDAMVAAAQGFGFSGDFATFVILGSVLMTVTTIFGFKTLDRLALVAVPLLAGIFLAVCVMAVRKYGFTVERAAAPPVPMSFGIALSALIGGNMLAVATMPDLSRFASTERGAVGAMALSFPIAAPLLILVSAIPALAMGEFDIMKMIVEFGLGIAALFLVVLSSWTINALNLYSASLSLTATFPGVKQWAFIVAGGTIGAIFALAGIINAFIPFLLFLGLIVPPIAAIYAIDAYTTFRGSNPAESIRRLPQMRWHAVGTYLVSILIAVAGTYLGWTLTTVPTLDATIVAAIIYYAILKFRSRRAGHAPPAEETAEA